MSTLEHIASLWPDADFSEAELRIMARESKGISEDQARAALDEVKATRSARKPAVAWIVEALRGLRRERKREMFKGVSGFFDSLRTKWSKDGATDAGRMSDRQVCDLYWQRQVDHAIEVYGESQGFEMLRRRVHEWASDLDRAGFQYGLARTFVQEQLEELWRNRIEPAMQAGARA